MIMTAVAMSAGGWLQNRSPSGAVAQILDDRRITAESTLHLQGGMADVKALKEKLLDPAQDFGLLSTVLRGYLQMSRQCNDMGTDSPEIEMMDIIYTVHTLDRLNHRGGAHSARHTFEQDMC